MSYMNQAMGGPSPEDANNAANTITQQGGAINSAAQGGNMSPQQAQQYGQSFNYGSQLGGIFQQNVGQGNADQNFQNGSPLNQSIYNNVLNQSQNPTAGWQSTLQPQLEQAQNQINEYYNNRGLMNSGLAIGASDQAGIDLAIQNAQNEMTYQQQSLSNAGNLSKTINSQNQGALSNLLDLFGNTQQFGQASINNQTQAQTAASGYSAYPAEANLGSYYGGIAANQAIPGQLIGAGATLGAAFI